MRLLVLMLASCGCGSEECNLPDQYDWGFDYSFLQDRTTQNGIAVDTSGQSVNLDDIDWKIYEAKRCLSTAFPDDLLDAKWCPPTFNVSIDEGCIKVKVPDNWSWSCDGQEQLLADDAPQEACDKKGFVADKECPCKWRGGVQVDGVIITTPNLRMFKESAVKLITGCWYLYDDSRLAECAK